MRDKHGLVIENNQSIRDAMYQFMMQVQKSNKSSSLEQLNIDVLNRMKSHILSAKKPSPGSNVVDSFEKLSAVYEPKKPNVDISKLGPVVSDNPENTDDFLKKLQQLESSRTVMAFSPSHAPQPRYTVMRSWDMSIGIPTRYVILKLITLVPNYPIILCNKVPCIIKDLIKNSNGREFAVLEPMVEHVCEAGSLPILEESAAIEFSIVSQDQEHCLICDRELGANEVLPGDVLLVGGDKVTVIKAWGNTIKVKGTCKPGPVHNVTTGYTVVMSLVT